MTDDVAALCSAFMAADVDARRWATLYPDESEWESPDCDEMAGRFLHFAKAAGAEGHLYRLDSVDEGPHWVAVLESDLGADVAVDWTARQFHNAGYPAPPTEPSLIPCPLVFDWPGRYPLDVVTFQEVRLDDSRLELA